jgi:hypothetical protein
MRIQISTSFDCTVTGVTGHFRSTQLPLTDCSGQHIVDESQWHKSRNQQRNFETLVQLISLYTQPLDITNPVYDSRHKLWTFEFTVEFPGIFATEFDPLGILKQQAQNVPMITGLNECAKTSKQLITDTNIFFQELNITQ